MPRLGELLKKYREAQGTGGLPDGLEEVEYTVFDCRVGMVNYTCYTYEDVMPVVIPKTVEGANEIIKIIEEGWIARVKAVKTPWGERVLAIKDVRRVDNVDEIEIDGEYLIAGPSSAGGLILQAVTGDRIIIKGGTVNYARLVNLYKKGVRSVAAKLFLVNGNTYGLKRALGIWIYPLELAEEQHKETHDSEVAEQSEREEQVGQSDTETIKQSEETKDEDNEEVGVIEI